MQEAFELGQRASVDRVEPGTKVQEEAPRLLIVIPDSNRLVIMAMIAIQAGGRKEGRGTVE